MNQLGIGPDDRRRTGQLHGIQLPSSMRDASGVTDQINGWKNPPTLIQEPRNGTRREIDPAGPRRPASVLAPFSHRVWDTLSNNKQPATPINRTAAQTVLSHQILRESSRPTKRSKMYAVQDTASDDELHSAVNTSKFFDSSDGTRSKFRQSYPTSSSVQSKRPLYVDSSGSDPSRREERPRTVSSKSDSPDPLNCISSRTQSPFSRENGGHNGRHDGAASSGSAPVEDGPATQRLHNRIKKAALRDPEVIEVVDDDSESISMYSEGEPRPSTSRLTSPHGTKLPANNVQSKVQMYNRGNVPELDLRTVQIKPPSRKSAMKGRSATSDSAAPASSTAIGLLDPVATTASGFKPERSKRPLRAKKDVQSTGPIALPLEAWALGCNLYEDEDSGAVEPCSWLIYDPGTLSLIVQDHPIGGHQLGKFKAPSIDSLSHTMEKRDESLPVLLQFRLQRSLARSSGITGFAPGSKGMDGLVTFKFMTKHANWIGGEAYNKIIKALKLHVKNIDLLNSISSSKCWEQTLEAVKMKKLEMQEQASSSTLYKAGESSRTSSGIRGLRPAPRPAHRGVLPLAESRTREGLRQSAGPNVISPSPEPDELILVYPPTGAGAININKSDLKRLNDKEMFNDTLIEFALKLWLADLRDRDPVLADQIHIFNSFFYKKLNVKDKEEGYQSVRKWTSKFDLFAKKYIIVPINENLHWYLAIIYRPDRVLIPPRVTTPVIKPMTRKRKRDSESLGLPETEDATEVASVSSRPPEPEIVPDSTPSSPRISHHDSEAEMEVEHLVGSTQSISISDPKRDASVDPDSHYDHMELAYPSSPERHPDVMDIDEPGELLEDKQITETTVASASSSSTGSSPDGVAKIAESVPVSVFYGSASGSASRKGKEKATTPLDVDEGQRDDDADDVVASDSSEFDNTAYVFIFDSLGNRHPQAIKTLVKYLELEAKDKKGLTEITPAQGKHTLLPTQPNWYDCGLYVIHFARTFFSNLDTYYAIIMATRKKGYTAKDRERDWFNERVSGIREELKERIHQLSIQWKRDRAEKDAQQKEAEKQAEGGETSTMKPAASPESLDDDVIIEDIQRPPKRTKVKKT